MMFSFGLWVDMLSKAVGHKYIKRIPYQAKGKRRYRYIYKVTHSHQGKHAFDESHLQVGTAFSLSTKAGSEYHGHVVKVEGDQVSYRIDDGPEKGTVKTESKRELLAKLNDVHDIESQLTSERDKLRNQIKEARKNRASEKQIARLESRLSRLGGEQEGEKQETEESFFSQRTRDKVDDKIDVYLYRYDVPRKLTLTLSPERRGQFAYERGNAKASKQYDKEDNALENQLGHELHQLITDIQGFLLGSDVREDKETLERFTWRERDDLVDRVKYIILNKLKGQPMPDSFEIGISKLIQEVLKENLLPTIEDHIKKQEPEGKQIEDGLLNGVSPASLSMFLDEGDVFTDVERYQRGRRASNELEAATHRALEQARAYEEKGLTAKDINKLTPKMTEDPQVYDLGEHGSLTIGDDGTGSLRYVLSYQGRDIIEDTIGLQTVHKDKENPRLARKYALSRAQMRAKAPRALVARFLSTRDLEYFRALKNAYDVTVELQRHEAAGKIPKATERLKAFDEATKTPHFQNEEVEAVSITGPTVENLESLSASESRLLKQITQDAKRQERSAWTHKPFQQGDLVGASDGSSVVYKQASESKDTSVNLPPIKSVIPSHEDGFSLNKESITRLKRMLKNAPESVVIYKGEGVYQIDTEDGRNLLTIRDPRGFGGVDVVMSVGTKYLQRALGTSKDGLTIKHGTKEQPLHIMTDSGFNHVVMPRRGR